MTAKMREFWNFVKPPAVEEDDSDTGTALYAPPLHLFGVRLVLAIILTVMTCNTYISYHFSFPHMFTVIYFIEAVNFFVLAAASLSVAFDLPVKICGTPVEALYFTAAVLSIAITVVDPSYYPLLIITFTHFSMAPKIRVRPWFIVLPVLCHVPFTISDIFFARFPLHRNVLIYFLELLGLAVAGVVALVMTEIMKYAEFKQGMQLGMDSRPTSYSAIGN